MDVSRNGLVAAAVRAAVLAKAPRRSIAAVAASAISAVLAHVEPMIPGNKAAASGDASVAEVSAARAVPAKFVKTAAKRRRQREKKRQRKVELRDTTKEDIVMLPAPRSCDGTVARGMSSSATKPMECDPVRVVKPISPIIGRPAGVEVAAAPLGDPYSVGSHAVCVESQREPATGDATAVDVFPELVEVPMPAVDKVMESMVFPDFGKKASDPISALPGSIVAVDDVNAILYVDLQSCYSGRYFEFSKSQLCLLKLSSI